MLENLSQKDLQTLIGLQTLEKLENIIPYITDSGISAPSDIYKKKNLENIFISFAGEDSLYNQKFRRILLERLPLEDIQELADLIGISTQPSFQKYVENISKIEWGDNKETRTFLAFFGFPESYIPTEVEKKPTIEIINKPDVPYKKLKDFQIQVYQKATSKMQFPIQKFLIQMPTGSGKTRTAMELISTELNNNPEKSILWIANSDELCEQAIECFIDVWVHVGEFDINVVRAWGQRKIEIPKESSFIVGGFSKLNASFKKNPDIAKEISNNLYMIVVDEAHQVMAPTYKKVVNLLLEDNYYTHLVGLTATPGRSSDLSQLGETDQLSAFFDRTLITIDSGQMSVFNFLREKGILASVQTDPLISKVAIELTENEIEHIKKYLDFPPSLITRLSQDELRNLEIINKLRNECKSGNQILFFAGSIEQSKYICALLNFLGYRAEHLDGNTKRDRRKNIVQSFKSSEIQVICNFGILTTGFDAPKTDVVFIARPTLSVVLYSQMIGRGLRGPAIGGTEKCKVIDVIDNFVNYENPENVYDYFEMYWDIYD